MRKRKGDDLAERILDFVVRIIKVAEALPKTNIGKHIYNQIIRSSTSIGANYEEARVSESNADFIHKLGITLKELCETRYWLRIIVRVGLISPKRMDEVTQECDELCRIVGKSIGTVKKKKSNLK